MVHRHQVASILTLFILILFTFTTSIQIKAENEASEIQPAQITQEPSEGYTLFSPIYTDTTYLIDNNGTVVHTWTPDYRPGQVSYLLENGHLLYTTFKGLHPIFITGGMGGGIQEITWNGTVLWDYSHNGDTYLSHHDIEPLPNGNILLIAWEYKSYQDCITAGRNPDLLPLTGLWPDYIVEIKSNGSANADIIWEWHIWDHLVQDFDPAKDNYGNIAEHPELIDINYVENPNLVISDWTHTNSIDYHPGYDQILLSISKFSEIWVIDHSTTTEEAANHSGGFYGKGGDILYRWGNPQTYGQGQLSDQQFYNQHDAQWISDGLPGEGNILVFNNGNSRPDGPYSTVDEIIPPVDNNGSYYLAPHSSYEPTNPTWSYSAPKPTDFYSSIVSGVQRFPNGNTLICSGEFGQFFEINQAKDIIWEYTNPYPRPIRNTVFKIQRYPPTYPGLYDIYQRPAKPTTPHGSTIGKIDTEYSFTTSTTDPNNDLIYYQFDWGDNTITPWYGPYNNSEPIHLSHTWENRGNYEIRVKAKDTNNSESNWSDPKIITIPTNILDLFILILQRILSSILEMLLL
jgi:hypothetical protein